MTGTEFFCVTLNIADTRKVWDLMEGLYKTLPGWRGFQCGCPVWQQDGGWSIQGSVEPGGLQLSGEAPPELWTSWLEEFQQKASALLGYAVGAPEDGFSIPEGMYE